MEQKRESYSTGIFRFYFRNFIFDLTFPQKCCRLRTVVADNNTVIAVNLKIFREKFLHTRDTQNVCTKPAGSRNCVEDNAGVDTFKVNQNLVAAVSAIVERKLVDLDLAEYQKRSLLFFDVSA